MKKSELKKELEIPEGAEASIHGNEIAIKKNNVEIKKRFTKVFLIKEGNKIIIKTNKATKREKRQINSIVSHLKNMFAGLDKKFVYRLQICAVHFPMTATIKGKEISIKNFLGETKERKARIMPDAEVKIEGDIISVESFDKDAAGQTAANIEKATRLSGRDRRVFQDGIFMIEKAGRKI